MEIPAKTIHNKKGNVLEFVIPHGYSFGELYLLSETNALHKKYYIPTEIAPSKKDLTHVGITEEDDKSGWAMSREIYHMQTGETRKIVRDSTWTAVGLQEIADFGALKGFKLDDWVLNWNTYS